MRHHMIHFLFAITVLANAVSVLAQTTETSPRKIELQCGQHKVAITCSKVPDPDHPEDKRQCNHNTLSFTNPDGKAFISEQPKNFRQEFVVKKEPVGIACAQGKDGKHYITVVYSVGPIGCGPCSTADLFESSGKRLTVNSRNLDSIHARRGIPYVNSIYIEGDNK